jgi:hypothetical protein
MAKEFRGIYACKSDCRGLPESCCRGHSEQLPGWAYGVAEIVRLNSDIPNSMASQSLTSMRKAVTGVASGVDGTIDLCGFLPALPDPKHVRYPAHGVAICLVTGA